MGGEEHGNEHADDQGADDAYDDEFDRWDESDPSGVSSRRRSRGVGILAALAVLVALAVLGYVGLSRIAKAASDVADGTNATGPTVPATPDARDSAAMDTEAQRFLAAWQSGKDAAAAALTDSPAAAKAALDAYHADLHVSKLTARVIGPDDSGAIAFAVRATVNLPAGADGAGSPARSAVWSYDSHLNEFQNGKAWQVQWQPGILAPNLSADTHLALVPVEADAGRRIVTDAEHNDLADSPEPVLRRISALLSGADGSGYAPAAGSLGIDVAVVDASGEQIPGLDAAVVAKPSAGAIATTIDAKTEVAALAAVQKNDDSSMVVLRPSDGHILAIANNDGGLDNALIAQIAPGSTMKVVTAAALLDSGLSADSGVACPASLDVDDAVTHNSGGESRPAGTPLIDDFASSCNNAFAAQYGRLSGDLLEHTAQRYFGLNEDWDIGLGQPTTYFHMRTGQPDKEVAAEAFGQGTLEAGPLAMASVAATVDTGVFHQPVLLPGAHQVAAAPLPSGTDGQLKQMMRAVITYADGTAHGSGFGSGVYAKTGTAEDQAGYPPNSWFIAFDPALDIAIGCVVLNAGGGNQYAGPETLSVIRALSS